MDEQLETILGVHFQDQKLLELALTHLTFMRQQARDIFPTNAWSSWAIRFWP